MNRDDVIRLAKKTGVSDWIVSASTCSLFYDDLCKFAALVEAESKPARKKKPTYDALGRLVELGVDPEMAETWIKQRKAPLTELAIKLTEKEAQAAGYTMAKAVEEVVVSGWQGFREAYVRGKQAGAKLSRAFSGEAKKNEWADELMGRDDGRTIEVSDERAGQSRIQANRGGLRPFGSKE